MSIIWKFIKDFYIFVVAVLLGKLTMEFKHFYVTDVNLSIYSHQLLDSKVYQF